MSTESIKLYNQQQAVQVCATSVRALEVGLKRTQLGLDPLPPTVMYALVRAAEFAVEQTGSSRVTDRYRRKIAQLKEQVVARGVVKARPRLRLVKS